MSNIELFSIGNALVDQEFMVTDAFLTQAGLVKGTMQLCDAHQQADLFAHLSEKIHKGQASGGSAANTTVAFRALGGKSFYACRVGNDALADFYLADLADVGVATATQSISEGQTGTCVVLITEDGERTMYTHLGITAELSDEQVDLTPLKSAQWLYIEGYLATSPSAQIAVKKSRDVAKAHGVQIALSLSDPAMVQYARTGLEQLLDDGVDMLFCNEQEALLFTQSETLAEAAEKLLTHSKAVAITLGAKGALILQQDQPEQWIAGQSVDVIDSNGAGDAFAGAFLYALTRNESFETAAKLGNQVAAQVVSQFGPRLSVAQYQGIAQQM